MGLLAKKRFLQTTALFALISLISGCVSTPTSSEVSVKQDTNYPKEESIPQNIVKKEEKFGLKTPSIELTKDILYKLIVAEIAGHRGEIDIAIDYYLDLAISTQDPKIIERATRIAVYARNDKASYEAASLWVEVDPENPDPHQVLTVMNLRKGNLDQALKHLEIILEASDGDFDQKIWMVANFLGGEEDKSMVIKLMESLMNNHMDDVDALFAYAHILSRIGEDERSKLLLEKILEIKPGNEAAIMAYVSLLQRKGDMNKAVSWLENILKIYNNKFNLRMTYARLLTDVERFDEARKQFEILYRQEPENTDLIYALGLLSLQENENSESEKYFKKLIKQKKYLYDANYYLGRIAEQNNEYDRAVNLYRNVYGGENYFDALIRVSLIFAERGDIEEALNNIRSVEKPKDLNRNILIQAEAEILIGEKRFEEALDIFNKAIVKQSHPDLLYSRAMLAEKIDRIDILEADLLSIIENNPNNASALNALGYTLADRGQRLDEAYDYIKRAYELSPGDFYILYIMGWVLYRIGRLDEAISFLQKALDLRNDPEVAAHLGEVYWVMGNKKAAKAVWETALQDTPADDRLLKVIERFKP